MRDPQSKCSLVDSSSATVPWQMYLSSVILQSLLDRWAYLFFIGHSPTMLKRNANPRALWKMKHNCLVLLRVAGYEKDGPESCNSRLQQLLFKVVSRCHVLTAAMFLFFKRTHTISSTSMGVSSDLIPFIQELLPNKLSLQREKNV